MKPQFLLTLCFLLLGSSLLFATKSVTTIENREAIALDDTRIKKPQKSRFFQRVFENRLVKKSEKS